MGEAPRAGVMSRDEMWAEVERLRDEVERLREELALRDDSLANRKVRELRAEVERLREAYRALLIAHPNHQSGARRKGR